MQTLRSLRPIAWLLAAAVLNGCASHAPRSSSSIEGGIAGALASSSLGSYTKAGCLSSLRLWATETTVRPPSDISSGLFFLGDSYLVYDFEYLVGGDAAPGIAVQSSDSTRHVRIRPSQASELIHLVSASRDEPAPHHQPGATHITCVIFLDAKGDYFVAYPDETDSSMRYTDRAISLLGKINQDAP